MGHSKGNIILTGFMGVGKGRTAREVAALSGMFAIDTDDLIESLVKRKIREIFAEQGEGHFREMEKQTARWIEKNVRNTIVSTGGGFFQVPSINKLGTVVYLHSSLEAIIKALGKQPNGAKKFNKRPLLQDPEQARNLFLVRQPLYRQAADLVIEVEGKTPRQVAEELTSLLGLPQA